MCIRDSAYTAEKEAAAQAEQDRLKAEEEAKKAAEEACLLYTSVTHSGEGEGLLFFGNVILPFVDRFPTDLELYRIMTTKLGEVSEGVQK